MSEWVDVPAGGGWEDVPDDEARADAPANDDKGYFSHENMQRMYEQARESSRPLVMKSNRRDEGVDYDSGIDKAGFRASFSRMDTPDERAKYLDKTVGTGNWGLDSYGAYVIKPKGLNRLGVKNNGLPVAMDEHRVTLNDIADWRGDAPAIAGGIAAGMATGGMGFIPSLLAVGGGAISMKGADETGDYLRGDNTQSLGEVAGDVATEGGLAMLGEGAYRGLLRPLGRKLMAPEARRMTAQGTQAMEDALDLGLRPSSHSIHRAPIASKLQMMMDKLFGDPRLHHNSVALHKNIAELKHRAGPHTPKTGDIGEMASESIKQSRVELSKRASSLYKRVDDAAQGQPFISTEGIKQQALNILDEMPRGKDGQVLFSSKDTIEFLKTVNDLPDKMTASGIQSVRQSFFDAMHGGLTEGVNSRHARMLYRATRDAIDEAAKDETLGNPGMLLKRANEFYKHEIKKFDDALVQRIAKDPGEAAAIEPEKIVDVIFNNGTAGRVARVKKAVSPEVWSKIQHRAMDDILESLVDRTSDPVKEIFNGVKLMRVLEKHGEQKLEQMFGKELAGDLQKFARAAHLTTTKAEPFSGGLVVAHVALHPLQNLGRLAQLKVISKVLNSETGLRWMTTGLKAPRTRAGMDAITRLTTMVTALAEDETGSPTLSLTAPESPEQIKQRGEQ